MAVTRGATVTPFVDSSAPIGTSFSHTVDTSSTMLVVAFGCEGDLGVSAPFWNTTEAMSPIGSVATSAAGGDARVYLYGLVNPTVTTANVTFSTSGAGDNLWALAVNYLGTETSSLAAATNLIDTEDNANGASQTVALSGATTAGSCLVLAGTFYGADGDPATESTAGGFSTAGSSETGTSTTADTSYYYGDDVDGGTGSTVSPTIDWTGAASDECVGVFAEILPAGTTATALAAAGADVELEVDTNYRWHFRLECSTAADQDDFKVQYNHESGGWTDITDSSDVVQVSASAYFTHGADVGEYLTGTGTYLANNNAALDTSAAFTLGANLGSGEAFEGHLCFQIVGEDVADDDTIQLRVVRGDGTALEEYTDTPTITVNKETATGINAGSASLGITANAASVLIATAIVAASASLSITPNSAAMAAATNIQATSHTLTLTENAASLSASSAISAASQAIGITANAAAVEISTGISAGSVSLGLTENAASTSFDHALSATSASLSITANDAVVTRAATALAAAGEDVELATDTNYRWHFRLECSTAADQDDFKVQYNLESAGWNDISSSSDVVRTADSSFLTHGSDVPESITGSGSYVSNNNAVLDTSAAFTLAANLGAGEAFEGHLSFLIVGEDVTNADEIQLRVVRGDGTVLDAYTETPTITVLKTGAVSLNGTSQAIGITANAANVNAAHNVWAASQSLTLTENDAQFGTAIDIEATSQALTITASQLAFTFGLNAQSQSLGITANDATVSAAKNITAASQALTLSENAATILSATNVSATSASLSLTENSASVSAGNSIGAGSASLSLTENAATISATTAISAGSQSLSITPNDASVVLGLSISADSASLSLTEYAASINAANSVTATSQSLTVTERQASLNSEVRVAGSSQALGITANNATVILPTAVAADSVSLSLSANRASVVRGLSNIRLRENRYVANVVRRVRSVTVRRKAK